MIERLIRMSQELQERGIEQFQQDLQDPSLNPPHHSEEFMKRANYIGLALRDNGFPDVAKCYYGRLVDEGLSYRQTHGVRRHLGTIYANMAIACLLLNDIDQALYYFHQAANEDAVAGISHKNSYANVLLEDRFTGGLKKRLLTTAQTIDNSITMGELNTRWSQLADGRAFAFIAFTHTFYRNIDFQHNLGNVDFEYTYWQIFSAVRNLSALLEVELKSKAVLISGQTGLKSLLKIAEALYDRQPWWQADFDTQRTNIGATLNSSRASKDVIRDALRLVPTSTGDHLWRNLIVVYTVRNHTAHDMQDAGEFSTHELEAFLASILYVLLKG